MRAPFPVTVISVSFVWLHLCLAGLWQTFSWKLVALCAALCLVRRFAVTRRFDTSDRSRDGFVLALATLGEGWYDHHPCRASGRPGIRWWGVDPTDSTPKALSWVGIVRDIRPLAAPVLGIARS